MQPNINLSAKAYVALRQLKLIVEIHDRKHYAIHKNAHDVIQLVQHSMTSDHAMVKNRLRHFQGYLNSDMLHFFHQHGLELDTNDVSLAENNTPYLQSVK